MKIKPHGAFYLIPTGLLLLGVIVAVVLFAQLIFEAAAPVEILEYDDTLTYESSEGGYIFLYIEDTQLLSFDFEEQSGYSTLTYETTNGIYQLQIDVINTTSSSTLSGYSFIEYEAPEENNPGIFYNFVDIEFSQAGTYEIIISSDDDVEAVIGYLSGDYIEIGFKAIIAGFALLVGIGGAIISFVIIIILRGKSKNNIPKNNPYISDDLQTSFVPNNNYVKKEEKEDENPDQFDF